MIYGFFGF